MGLRHPRLLIGLLVVPLLLVLAVAGLVRFALPGLVRSEASRYVLEHTGHRLDFDAPQIRLFGPQLQVANLRLTEPDGKPLLSFASLEVRLSGWALLRGDLQVTALGLTAPRATVTVHPDGSLNWSALIGRLQALQGAPKPRPAARQPTAVEIDALQIQGAEIDAADERVGLAVRAAPIDLSLAHMSTTGDASGHYRLSARTSVGARLALEGDAVLAGFHTSGTLQVEGLQLGMLAPLLEARAPVRVPAGVAGLQTHYDIRWKEGVPEVVLDALGASLHALRVEQRRPGGPALEAGDIRLEGGHFELRPQQLQFARLQVEHARVSLPRSGAAPLETTLGRLAVEQLRADLVQRRAQVAQLALDEGRVEATRGKDGSIDLLGALQAARGGAAGGEAGTAGGKARPAGGEAGAAAPWHFALDRLTLAGFQARLRDESVQPAAELAIAPIAVEVSGISEDLQRALPVRASLRFASGGSFEAHGQVVPASAAADLSFRLADLALKPAQPYLSRFARLDIRAGQFSLGGRVRTGGKDGASVQGDFALQQLRLEEAGSHNLFLGLSALATRKFDASARRLVIPQLTLAGLDTQLLIAKDKSVNLSRILVGSAKPAPAGPAPAQRAAPGPGLAASGAAKARAAPPGTAAAGSSAAFEASIEQLRISDSAMDFADQSLALPFGTRIHHLHGVINGLSTRKGARGQLQLDGQVDDFGSAHAEGRLDLLEPTAFMDIKVIFRNVEMTRLTPYSATFAGRRINSGKLSLDLEYKIDQRRMSGDNQVVMDKLTLGERVDSPGATNLPLDLAIAILSDADGRIDLGLPVSGSLDDPQFSYGRIIWKAIVNVIGKIVLSPFRALGALFGGSGDKFESVGFAPGSAALAPPEREKLVKIAAALAKRPGIALTAPASYSEADRPALQDLAVRRAIAARAGQAVAADEDPGPVAVGSPDAQAAIAAEFGARLGAQPLAALRKAAQPAGGGPLPDSYFEDLITRLRAAQPVSDGDLQALGQQRASAVSAGLREAGVAESRLAVGAAAKVDLQDGNVPLKFAPATAQATR